MICYVVIVVPFVFRLTLASLIGLDRDCENAAITLGATRWTVFSRITLSENEKESFQNLWVEFLRSTSYDLSEPALKFIHSSLGRLIWNQVATDPSKEATLGIQAFIIGLK